MSVKKKAYRGTFHKQSDGKYEYGADGPASVFQLLLYSF